VIVSSSFILWLVFSPIAALMAFLITYGEYSHHYADRGPVLREALRTGLFTLTVFLVLGLIVSFILPRALK
jgi:hypothetical protein